MGEFEATGKNRDEKKEEGSGCREAGDYRKQTGTQAGIGLKPAGSTLCKK
jgi:hypothetical protein